MKIQVKPKLQARRTQIVRVAPGIGIFGCVVFVTFFIANLLRSEDAAAASICGSTISTTTTISSSLTCTSNLTVDGATLYVEAPLTLTSSQLEIRNEGVVYIRNGGSLDARNLYVKDESYLSIAGNVSLDGEFKIEGDDTEVILNEGYKVTCSNKFQFRDESIMQIAGEFEFTGSNQCEVSEGSELLILSSGTFSYNSTNQGVRFYKGVLDCSGSFSSTKSFEFNDCDIDFRSSSLVSLSEDISITENTTFDMAGTLSTEGKVDVKKSAVLTIAGEFTLSNSVEFKVTEKGVLNIQNHGTLTLAGNIKAEHNDTKVTIEPGGWLLMAELGVANNSEFLNNGYVEHTNSANTVEFDGVGMTGEGVFYCLVQSKLSLKNGGDIFGKSASDLSDDMFVLGLDTIRAKRLPKLKIEESGWVLGDSLVVSDTLDLNGFSLDIDTFDFKLPSSFSFSRTGSNSEYIATSSSGRYNMEMLENNKDHIAPIGRNPYLPMIINCADCAGIEFAVSVTENIYLNPEQLTNQLTTNTVNETWTVVPEETFSGSITITMQWNAGGGGTTNSELTGFTRGAATPYYWVEGTSAKWADDGVHIDEISVGSDPYSLSITLSGMTGGTEYYFGVGSSGTGLPIEFSSFEVEEKKRGVELTWETATELNNDYFEVQHSTDGLEWKGIDRLMGAGTSVSPNTYSAYHSTPENGINYYRIKQVDFDEATCYSLVRVVEVVGGEHGVLAIEGSSPNPFNSFLKVEYKSTINTKAIIELLDMNGNTVYSQMKLLPRDNSCFSINGLGGLSAGEYLLRVRARNVNVTEIVLKQ